MKILKSLFLFLLCFSSFAEVKKVKVAFSDDTVTAAPKFVDLIVSAYKQIGIDVEYEIFPSIRALKVFNEGEFQAMGARISHVKDYSTKAILIEPPIVTNFKIGLIGLNESKKDDINYDKDIFILIRGNFTSKVVKDHFKIQNILEAKSTVHAIELLKNKRGKWIANSELGYLSISNRNDLFFSAENTLASSIHHIISKEIIALKPKLDAVFQKMKADGYFDPKKIVIKELKPLVK